MKSKILALLLLCTISLNVFSQNHMRFMGVSLDGHINDFCEKIQNLGFVKDSQQIKDAICYTGRFYGEEAFVQVNYNTYNSIVYGVNVYIVKQTTMDNYLIQKNILNTIENKYKYEKDVVNSQLYQYDYYIFEELDPIGLIQTFIVDSKTIPQSNESMLSINYIDVKNYLDYEKQKENSI